MKAACCLVAAGIVGTVASCRFSPSGNEAATQRPDQDAQPSLMAQVRTSIEQGVQGIRKLLSQVILRGGNGSDINLPGTMGPRP